MMSDKVSRSIQLALEQLHEERERIEGAIAKLEGFLGNLVDSATASIKRRGRPAAAAATPAVSERRPVNAGSRNTSRVRAAKTRSREGWTDEARKAAAERMRKYWGERRKASADGTVKNSRRRRAANNDAANDTKERSRKGWTDDARKAAAERMKKYWEDRKKSEAAG